MNSRLVSILLVIGILVFVVLLSKQFFFRIDLTEDNQYTLSKATKDILRSLDAPITVKAYFSEELPPQIAKTRRDFEDYLIEYARLSGGNLVYQFINPSEDQSIEQEAVEAGVRPVVINVRKENQFQQQQAYLGAVLELGDQKEVIPSVQPGAAMEYSLSTAIKKMANTNKPTIGLIQGHGEPGLDELAQAQQSLSVLYNLEPYNLTGTEPIPDKYQTIAIVRPTDTIPPDHFAQLNAFLQRGGNLMVAINRVGIDQNSGMGTAIYTGMADWLASKGLIVEEKFVIDARCGSVSVPQQLGAFTVQRQIEFPYFPVLSDFADHPVTQGLEGIVAQFASPLTHTGDSSSTFTGLAFTSEQSGSLGTPQFFDLERQWTQADFPLQRIPVAGLLEGKAANGVNYRMVVVGDGDFAVNARQQNGQVQPQQPDNINLLVNGIDWLSDDTGLIELRTKGVQFRPLAELEESEQNFWKYLNFLLPIVLVIAYGIIRNQLNRNKRIKRMQENYG